MLLSELPTPALVVDGPALERNLARMAEALPAARLRPHVKAHKMTELARRQRALGHPGLTCATVREAVGLARAGLGDDILLANEVVDVHRLSELARSGARVTVAVDSEATIDAARRSGICEVLIDVNVGLPRCGCQPEDAGRFAEKARAAGLTVRGVMGYEGHLMGVEDRAARAAGVDTSMKLLTKAHQDVGGDVVSAGGTGSYDLNESATEIQAGSYALMDTAYAKLELGFDPALFVLATVISSCPGFAVLDAGLKCFGMDHGNPTAETGNVLFCSDEHTTYVPETTVEVGARVRLTPAHVDPTVAYHERVQVCEGEEIVDRWDVDLRGW